LKLIQPATILAAQGNAPHSMDLITAGLVSPRFRTRDSGLLVPAAVSALSGRREMRESTGVEAQPLNKQWS